MTLYQCWCGICSPVMGYHPTASVVGCDPGSWCCELCFFGILPWQSTKQCNQVANACSHTFALLGAAPCRKNQKAVEAALSEIGYTSLYFPRCHTRAVCGAHLALRGEVLAMVELRRQVGDRQLSAVLYAGLTALFAVGRTDPSVHRC